jgi:hypothetical protein
MLTSMKDRGRAGQFANRAGPGKFGTDAGFSLFVEILAREAVRSLTTSEDEQPGTCVANSASAMSKKGASPIVPLAIAQDVGKPACIQPPQPTGNNANGSDARQERLFD